MLTSLNPYHEHFTFVSLSLAMAQKGYPALTHYLLIFRDISHDVLTACPIQAGSLITSLKDLSLCPYPRPIPRFELTNFT